MLLPGLCCAGLFIASMIIRFMRKMKRITVEKYYEAPPIDDETKRRIKAIIFSEQLPGKQDENYLEVDCFGNLQEVWKHPI